MRAPDKHPASRAAVAARADGCEGAGRGRPAGIVARHHQQRDGTAARDQAEVDAQAPRCRRSCARLVSCRAPPPGAETVLKASHQFPGGKGDPRDEMVQIIAREVEKANVGLKIQVCPAESLFKAKEQWGAITKGQLDMTALPLDYAERPPPAVQRHADAGAGEEPRARQAPQQVARSWTTSARSSTTAAQWCSPTPGWPARSPRRRDCILDAGRHQGQGDARRRPGVRADAGRRPAPRSRRCRARRSTPACRPACSTPPTPAPAASCRAACTSWSKRYTAPGDYALLVHVRAGTDLEEDRRTASDKQQQDAAARRRPRRPRTTSPARPRSSTTRRSRPSRRPACRS
ncbi:MAG: hypothetical protein MZV65_19230 [Chromatiales bacterium]|nr:hypothetical protein [Chromatiales bacterium]